MKILIADDEVITAHMFKMKLSRLGFKAVMMAHSGEEAIDIAGQARPDIILMDISMTHRTDGIEACNRIKKVNPGIKVIFISAFHPEMFANELGNISYDGYIDKAEFVLRIKQYMTEFS